MAHVEHIVEVVATVIGYVGISFIVLGAVLAIIQYIISRFDNKYTTDHVRLTLGTYILIGLEFMVGQDIIETVLHTTMEQLYILGLIVVIRTILDFFLSREMTHLKQHIKEHEKEYSERSEAKGDS
jgi:uncharacterized membrane protein